MPATRSGLPNSVVGLFVFSFVGSVYYYTLSNLRKQGGQLSDDLDALAEDISAEKEREATQEIQ